MSVSISQTLLNIFINRIYIRSKRIPDALNGLSISHPEIIYRLLFAVKALSRVFRAKYVASRSNHRIWKRGKLQQIQKELNVVRPIIEPKTQHKKCYCCKVGNLITLHVFGQRGPPKAYLIGNTLASVN